MQIDWITVTAQIVNFLILVWLLKHFLYEPVMRAVAKREQKISDRLNEAEQREQQADERLEHYEKKADELDRKREEILEEARVEAELQKRQMLEAAREDVAGMRSNWLGQLEEEKKDFLDNLRRQAIETIQATARKVLGDLADADLEGQIIQKFVDQLKNLDKAGCESLTSSSGPLRITTSFELDTAHRSRLTRAVHEYLAEDREVEYNRSPALDCGIELSSGGQRLAWHLADYMDDLTARIEGSFTVAGKTENVER